MKDGADNSPKCFKSFRSCHVRVLRRVLLGNLASVFYSSVHPGILTTLSFKHISLSLHTNIPTNILDEAWRVLERAGGHVFRNNCPVSASYVRVYTVDKAS